MYWKTFWPFRMRSTTDVALRTVSILSGVASPMTRAESAGPGKGMRLKSSGGESERPAELPHSVLAQLDERLEDAVSEGLLRIDPHLLEDVVLALDPGHGLVDVGQDRALEQDFDPAVLDEPAEDVLVEGLGDRLPLLLGVGDPLERGEELLAGVDDLDRDAELLEEPDDAPGLAFAHDPVLDEDGYEPLAQGPVSEHRDRG